MATRSHRRISRELLLGLGGMLMLALVFGAYNLGKGKGAAEAGKDGRGRSASALAIDDAPPLRQVTPTAPAPTPAPAGISTDGASAATTRPTSADGSATALAAGGATTRPTTPMLGAVAEKSRVTGTTTRPANGAADGAQLATQTNRPAAPATPAAPAAALSGNPLADAKTLVDAGKLLEARRILNGALASKTLSPDDAQLVKQMLGEINEVVIFSTRKFEGDEFGGTFVVPPGGALERIAKSHRVDKDLLMRLNGITDPRKLQAGQTIKVIKGPFHAVVDKTDFSLELWLGEPGSANTIYVTSFPVGLGNDDSTPTGVWAIKNKLENPTYYSPRGEGIVDADDPKNPLGERWIGLTGVDGNAVGKQSYGIHGTIEPESIGKQASMGCIRLTNDNVARVYEVLGDKSTVTVRE